VVVDHQGHPVVGAWVSFGSHFFGTKVSSRRPTRSDEKGHFASRNLYPGPTGLSVSYGKLKVNRTYLADGSPDEVRIQLPAQPEAVEPPNATRAPLPPPLAVGQPAPEWSLGAWSDGRLRILAEQRNRVVILYFWNMSSARSVSHLPVLAQLRNEFEPRGVFFLAIHGPGEDVKQVRKVLEFKKAPLLWAMDLDRQASTWKSVGATAWQYGLQPFPLVVGIDKNGKVAFRGDPLGWSPKPAAAEKNEKPEPNRKLAEESMNQSFQKELARQIEGALDRKD
ncbi:MAG: redoxin domain-containing protein, partial [Isosphaeraceae bacterium]